MSRIALVLGVAVTALGIQATIATRARAQSSSDYAALVAMKLTPVGGLPPVPVIENNGEGGPTRLVLRHGRFQYAPGDGLISTLGIGVQFRRRKSVVRLDVAMNASAECGTCGYWMAGVDITRPFRSWGRADGRITALDISWNPVFGYAWPSERDGSAFSAALNLPVTLQMPLGDRWRVLPFIAPGFGLGLVEAAPFAVGARPLLGGGIALASVSGRIQLSFGFRKVVLEGAASTAGFGIVLAR